MKRQKLLDKQVKGHTNGQISKKTLHTTGGLAQWRQLFRRQFCGNLHVITPQDVQWKPPLRQAAGTLSDTRGQCVRY